MHAPTSGQVRPEVIEGAEEWRPDAEVVGWVAGCTCGWRGTPWTRVPPGLADPAARRLATAGPVGRSGGRRRGPGVMTEWRRHIAGWQDLEEEATAAGQAAAARALDEAGGPHARPEPRRPTSAGPLA